MPGAVTRTRISGLSIVLAVAIGGGIAWLWSGRASAPHSDLQSAAAQKKASVELPGTQPDRHSGESPNVEPAVASVAQPSADAATGLHDDSTYDRMLAFAQSNPYSASTARDIIEKHERFLFTPIAGAGRGTAATQQRGPGRPVTRGLARRPAVEA